MESMKHFKPYNPEQRFLMPPDMREWLDEDHLALFVSDVVEELDLGAIYASYEHADGRGQPPYHPAMMVKLLVYAYCIGMPSSRRVERATHEDVAFRVLAAGHHPDHDSIAAFRKRHLVALADLFLQVLRLCGETGMVKLGTVALDGTKVKANASKHKAMSYGRMVETEKRLESEIAALMAEAETVDADEDARYGKGRRGDELPQELRRRESRLAKIREAKRALEAQQAQKDCEKGRQPDDERRSSKGGPNFKREFGVPDDKAQRNFTDPESRIMKDGATKGFEQSYNCQAAVDAEAQVIVAVAVTQEANDKKQLKPMMQKVKNNVGTLPKRTLADAGYYSEENVTAKELEATQLYVPPDKQKHGKPSHGKPSHGEPSHGEPSHGEPSHGEPSPPVRGRMPKNLSTADAMRRKLRTKKGRETYARRKAIVEPVFGQIKDPRGFRRFSFRGFDNVRHEWGLVCLTHNLLKLHRRKRTERAAKRSADDRFGANVAARFGTPKSALAFLRGWPLRTWIRRMTEIVLPAPGSLRPTLISPTGS